MLQAFGQASWGQTPCLEAFALRLTPLIAVLFALLFAAPASSAVPHVVQPGETLWSIAAANNLTTRTVAAFNGLSESSQVVLGATIMVPTTVEGYAALQKAGLVAAPAAAAPAAAPLPLRPPRRLLPLRPPRRPHPRRSPSAATPSGPATRSPLSLRVRACPSATSPR